MDTTKRRAQLGIELRKARNAAGITQQQAAIVLGCGQGKINKIETTQSSISPKDLAKLLTVYSPPHEHTTLIKMLAAHPSPGGLRTGMHNAYVTMREAEQRAVEVLSLHSERIPAPLQSDRYLLKQHHLAGDPRPGAPIIMDRDDRAAVFTDTERTTRCRVLLTESSLHRMPGGRTPGLVIDQAKYLQDLCDAYERLSVRILTYEAKIAFLDPDFMVLKAPNAKDDVAYIEYATEGRIFTSAKQVAIREKYWHETEHAALSDEDSKKYLSDLIEQAHTGWPGVRNE